MGKRTVLSVLLLLLLIGWLPQTAGAGNTDIDVYLLYQRTDKEAKSALLSALPKKMRVKTFNISLLALANFEEKQKVVAEIEKARAVVIISDLPMGALSGYRLNTGLLIINSLDRTVTSNLWMFHLMEKGVDVSTLKGKKLLEATDEKDLKNIRKRIWPFGVILVDPKTLGIEKAASVILQILLAPSGRS
jgi:hypothetical protein